MKKLIASVILGSSLLLNSLTYADGIKLTTPADKPVFYDELLLKKFSINFLDKSLTAIFSLGYWDVSGKWIETKSDAIDISNIPDDPGTPADESNPKYDNFLTTLKTLNLSIEDLDTFILKKAVKNKYPGTIDQTEIKGKEGEWTKK